MLVVTRLDRPPSSRHLDGRASRERKLANGGLESRDGAASITIKRVGYLLGFIPVGVLLFVLGPFVARWLALLGVAVVVVVGGVWSYRRGD
jgi:hypothetical protein